MSDNKRFRLVTRPDFDGVVCGALLKEKELIEDVAFAQPRAIQHNEFQMGPDDITANLPYASSVHLCFDHHISETERVGEQDNHVIDPHAPSAARVVYDYYGGKDGFPEISEDLMIAVDRADSADYTEEEILAPEGWVLLSFILDGRTGLSRFKDFKLSNEELMADMMTYCRHNPVDEILEIPDVAERVATYFYHKEFAELQIRRNAEVQSKVVTVDLRGEHTLFSVNRFLIYALYPECNVSVQLNPLEDGDMVEVAVGKSILDRGCGVNIGNMLLEYGGGGHTAVGTCRVAPGDADRVRDEIVQKLMAG